MFRALSVVLLAACAHVAPRVDDGGWLAGSWQTGSFSSRWVRVGGSLYGVELREKGEFEVDIVGLEEKRATLWWIEDDVKTAPVSLPLVAASTKELRFDDGTHHVRIGRTASGWTDTEKRDEWPHAVEYEVTAAPADESPELALADKAFDEATAARGADGWTDAFADDGTTWQPSGRVVGKDAIRASIEKTLARGALRWQPVASGARGDLGFTLGTWTFTPPGAPAPVAHGSYVTIWRRTDAGWKVVFDTGRPD
jgi:hypothetical protein